VSKWMDKLENVICALSESTAQQWKGFESLNLTKNGSCLPTNVTSSVVKSCDGVKCEDECAMEANCNHVHHLSLEPCLICENFFHSADLLVGRFLKLATESSTASSRRKGWKIIAGGPESGSNKNGTNDDIIVENNISDEWFGIKVSTKVNKSNSLKVFQFVQKSLLAGGRLQLLPTMVKIDEAGDGNTEVFHARFSIPFSKTREMCLLQHSRPNYQYQGSPLHLLATTSIFGHEVMKHHEKGISRKISEKNFFQGGEKRRTSTHGRIEGSGGFSFSDFLGSHENPYAPAYVRDSGFVVRPLKNEKGTEVEVIAICQIDLGSFPQKMLQMKPSQGVMTNLVIRKVMEMRQQIELFA